MFENACFKNFFWVSSESLIEHLQGRLLINSEYQLPIKTQLLSKNFGEKIFPFPKFKNVGHDYVEIEELNTSVQDTEIIACFLP